MLDGHLEWIATLAIDRRSMSLYRVRVSAFRLT
jgi:hypothetical protein